MGNTSLLRREAEMTLLQPHLGDSPFLPTPLFKSQSRMEKTSFLKKAPPKIHRVLEPIKTSPFVVPTTIRKEAPTGNPCMGAIPNKAVINRFPQVGENRTTEASGVFQGGEGMETPLPNDSLKASLSPPVGGCLCSFRRDWLANKCSDNVLNIITNGYILPFISKPNLVRAPLIRSGYKALQKDQPLASCIQSLLSKNVIERVENVASSRPKQAQHHPTCRKVQNGNTRVHQGLSDFSWIGVINKPIRCLPSHPHQPKFKEVPKVLPQVTGVPVHLPPLRASPSGLYNDCKRSEADGPDKGN